jgi:GNAT superfamily N-acetyltransferase
MSGKPQGTGAIDWLKPYVPQVLAYATVMLAIIGVAVELIARCGTDWEAWWTACAVMGAIGAFVLFLDPSKFGLHAFYRDRIVRAYLGASNRQGLAANKPDRATGRRLGDDVPMTVLRERPLQLVCAAANDLDGDPLGGLARGARSATLSRHGLSLENAWTIDKRVTLGSAVTAAAAAFNSNMGSLSMQLGPAVGFLASAMNLRLGLWLDLPSRPGVIRGMLDSLSKRLEIPQVVSTCLHAVATGGLAGRLLPGFRYYLEMFGMTRADADARELHLSDGGHFENLALYELVRRHCRYIIVSDCGQDAEVAFDDFGNASRRIREDFGVDIDIDLRPLRPENGLSRQHLVVGTINYTDFDKGILLYVKPTLTGDEPPDVLQYRTRNQKFPHETTSDQFYDEAQWESYRRLGKHTALEGFGFVSRLGEVTADGVFTQARQVWYPTPPGLMDSVLTMTNRFGSVELEIQTAGYSGILREVFPELAALAAVPAPAKPMDEKTAAAEAAARQSADLAYLLRMIQLMEDAFTACELDTQWNHPLNMGWTNCFARWATAPTFQMWWPLLAPMYGPDFGRFLQERFPVLRRSKEGGRKPDVTPIIGDPPDGIAWTWWQKRSGAQAKRQKPTHAYSVTLSTGGSSKTLQLGLATIAEEFHVGAGSVQAQWPGWLQKAGRCVATWTSDDFFVPPSLWGAGIGGEFMRELLRQLSVTGVSRCRVEITMPEHRNDASAKADRVGYIEFYKRSGFRLEGYDEAKRTVTLVLDAMP